MHSKALQVSSGEAISWREEDRKEERGRKGERQRGRQRQTNRQKGRQGGRVAEHTWQPFAGTHVESLHVCDFVKKAGCSTLHLVS